MKACKNISLILKVISSGDPSGRNNTTSRYREGVVKNQILNTTRALLSIWANNHLLSMVIFDESFRKSFILF